MDIGDRSCQGERGTHAQHSGVFPQIANSTTVAASVECLWMWRCLGETAGNLQLDVKTGGVERVEPAALDGSCFRGAILWKNRLCECRSARLVLVDIL